MPVNNKIVREFHGRMAEEMEVVRAEKAVKRGGFDERIYLVEVEDE